MGSEAQIFLGPIVGGLSHESANLWVRATGPCNIYGWLGSKPDLSDARFVGESDPPVKEDAFTGMVPVKRLKANTHYHYALTVEKKKPDPAKPAIVFISLEYKLFNWK